MVRMTKSCWDERFDELCVTTSFLKRSRMDGASISILHGARVHLSNTASVRKVRVKLYMLFNGVFRFWNFLDFGAYVIFDFWDGIVYYFCISVVKRDRWLIKACC